MLDSLITRIRPVDPAVVRAAREHQDRLTKPRGSLGELEAVSVRLAALAGTVPGPVPAAPAVAVFVGDHGVHAQGVSPWPREVTGQMVANFLAGGAVVNALARQVGATVRVVDVGMSAEASAVVGAAPGLDRRSVRAGTGDIAVEPAMTRDQALRAVAAGAEVAGELIRAGHDLLVTGDMGIANTTPSAALVAALLGADPVAVTGRGTGVDDETLARKVGVVRRAVTRATSAGAGPGDPLGVLAALGGLEHAATVGFMLAAAAARVPVLLDGVIACSSALVAAALAPEARAALFAGHRSVEPGASAALAALGLVPLLDLGMRLGEGSGGVLAVPVVQAAARVLAEVATFDGAGITDKQAG
ncbi:nicotinate-nucleotide--dimethylbenzimidazole phosphoribosyltransferase [Frankia sp. CNm7]|uniref:nicotinate-nucleotide--dimethylbenzimidazole phosphoribosyltransferase n=1 Tax=Frankia nepalensis TaxID=1836974 RepID=UPI001DF0C6EF|nr:nicotinate-nucleotide--dimethylbenzimidazole phosphoribosyltransferase [Frankia nepalensis]MBL7511614.1 nicotinate-nucleotide--dimethylbenzimidazole phosphoribosyltransferase [Frankia nepalensis]MBL7519719.1 nicotinate-nucleotide--dimethylbenzimidazole phosphoribosyltransferase [Frankia nepalensis]